MVFVEVLFWVGLFILFYTYLGYGLVLYCAIKVRRILGLKRTLSGDPNYEPEVTLLIPAYNEMDFVEKKLDNSRKLNYPNAKLHQLWVTDGSNDGSPDLLANYREIAVLHENERNGKISAMNRGIREVKTPIVVFSDANTMLSRDSIRRIVRLFEDPKVGCVSGEKRIIEKGKDAAAGSGEGLYWKYESKLKKWDAELNSVVGAAGELFAIRTELYTEIEEDTILDDFIISLRIAQAGYSIQYDPEAYAIEGASMSVEEELKRKIRISAGGIQAITRLKSLCNIFKYGVLSFQYISHRVLRWTLAPVALLVVFLTGMFLAGNEGFFSWGVFSVLFFFQCIFYSAGLVGYLLKSKAVDFKFIFIPYYFLMMNYSVILGMIRFLRNNQSVNWERSKREMTSNDEGDI